MRILSFSTHSEAGARRKRRGSALHTQVTGTVLLAVLSGVSVTGAMYISKSEGRSEHVERQQQSWIDSMARDGVRLAVTDLEAGGSGVLAGDNLPTRGWSTEVFDLGQSLRIVSRSYSGECSGEAEGLVAKMPLTLDSAVYLESSYPRLGAIAAGVSASGSDVRLDGLPGDGKAVADFVAAYPLPRTDLSALEERAGDGMPTFSAAPRRGLHKLVDRYAQQADRRLTGGRFEQGWGDEDANKFEVISIDGAAELATGLRGAGILTVSGDLRLSGQVKWVGAVIVTGDLVLDSGCDSKVIGSLMVAGQIRHADASQPGVLHVQYSSQAAAAVAPFVTYQVDYNGRVD